MNGCTNLCLRYKKVPRFNTKNSKYCPNCSIFLEFDGIACPCCHGKLRAKPRTARRVREYYRRNPEKTPKRI